VRSVAMGYSARRCESNRWAGQVVVTLTNTEERMADRVQMLASRPCAYAGTGYCGSVPARRYGNRSTACAAQLHP